MMSISSSMKREVTVEMSSEGWVRTGIRSDICQVRFSSGIKTLSLNHMLLVANLYNTR